jgi:pimeloyl-ACP methyl ester carboxylesterase
VRFDGGDFVLTGFARPGSASELLSVYLETDGNAWIDWYHPSSDPSPLDPTALRLALKDPAPGVVYLARPCQFVAADDARNCEPGAWTRSRFSERAVAATSRAIDAAKQAAGARQVRLYGVSGGGVLAALIAARRTDVVRLVTVAAPLDTAAWTRLHRVSPLAGSLEPRRFAAALAALPQIHFVGANDEIVPASVVQSFLAALPAPADARLIVVPGYDHECCWADAWPPRELQPRESGAGAR